MKPFYKYTILFILGIIALLGCKDEVASYDNPFVYITDKFGGSNAAMDCLAKYTSTYYVKLSSKKRTNDLTLYFKVKIGTGLQEGVDYTLDSSTVNSVVFHPNEYEKMIYVNWLPHKVDAQKDNSLAIVLESTNDKEITIGKPGHDKLGVTYTITKQ